MWSVLHMEYVRCIECWMWSALDVECVAYGVS